MTEPDYVWDGPCKLIHFQGLEAKNAMRKGADWLSETCSCGRSILVHLNEFHFMSAYFESDSENSTWSLVMVISYG